MPILNCIKKVYNGTTINLVKKPIIKLNCSNISRIKLLRQKWIHSSSKIAMEYHKLIQRLNHFWHFMYLRLLFYFDVPQYFTFYDINKFNINKLTCHILKASTGLVFKIMRFSIHFWFKTQNWKNKSKSTYYVNTLVEKKVIIILYKSVTLEIYIKRLFRQNSDHLTS